MPAKKHGVVYTKRWVVELILDVAGYSVDRPIWKQRICESSCGEGAFLNSIVSRVLQSAERDNALNYECLKDCLAAYDLDPESVEKASELVIGLLTAYGFESDDARRLANSWLHVADYLLDTSGSFDYVVGNPPYQRASDIDPDAREKYCERFSAMTKGCDIFVAFIQHGLESLAPGGNLTYICADRWLQNQYGKSLRQYVSSNGYYINTLIRMHGVDAFESEVDAYPSITKISKSPSDIQYVNCNPSFCENDAHLLWPHLGQRLQDLESDSFSTTIVPKLSGSGVIPLASAKRVKLVTDLVSRYPSLEDSGVSLGIGLATGNDNVFITDNPELVESTRLLPAFNMRDKRRGIKKERWLVNPWNRDNSLVELEEYPRLKAYFESHHDELSKRHVAKKGSWYRTIDKPKWSLLGSPMLLFPDMASKADPVYSDGSKYPCHNCYWLISDRWDLKALGGLLMSDIAEAFVDALGVKMRGGTLRFQAQYLRLIHVPDPRTIDESILRALAAAFDENDRMAANTAARKAYGLDEQWINV